MSDPHAAEGEAAPMSLAGMQLFTGQEQYQNFSNMKNIAAVRELTPSATPFTFPQGAPAELPATYMHQGEAKNLQKLLEDTRTGALLVIKDGEIRYENYWLTSGRDVQWISMSVGKSFTSALVGIALSEGLIESLDDPIDKYVPFLSKGGYGGVPIIDVLHMSSGVAYREEYENASDPNSDFTKSMFAVMTGNGRDYISSMARAFKSGTECNYNSHDTQTLGWLLMFVYGKSLTEILQEKLYTPLGMEYPGYFSYTPDGDEAAAGGLHLTARDYAKFGELYRLGGAWNGKQIVPADYVKASVSISAPQFAPGEVTVGNHKFGLGYGLQWWVPRPGVDFSAIGVYNQYIYCNPGDGTVIVKSSANPRYGLSVSDSDNKDEENLAAIQAISASLA